MPKGKQKRAKPLPQAPQITPLPSPWKIKLAAFGRSPLAFVAASLMLLVPCFWQSRIQAGDLSSHIYNAWLGQLIEQGRAPGLAISFQTTNVLFDLILSGLLKAFGAAAAQRLAVSLVVLVFAWGAFAFVSTVSGRRGWSLMPSIAILSYGWVFHMGFFNFYLSFGLCLWALSLAWEWKPRRIVAAAAILLVAYIAHPLPVALSIAVLAYVWLARRIPPARRTQLLAGTILIMVLARLLIAATMESRWFSVQLTMITGLDQVHVYGGKYWCVYVGLLLIWALLLTAHIRRSGARNVITGIPFHLCVLGAAGIIIFPDLLNAPVYAHALAFIAQRMSLAVAILICALLAAAPTRAYQHCAAIAVALLFFGFL